MSNADIRNSLGNLAELILPHLQGKPFIPAGGLAALSTAKDSDFVVEGLALELRPFQRAGVEYIVRCGGRAIVGDEMGLGKTPQAQAAIVRRVDEARLQGKKFTACVACPPSLTLNWVREFAKFAPHLKVVRLTGQTPYLPEAADVYVIGDAVLSHWQDTLIGLDLDALVLDESHRYKSRTAGRTKAAQEIARRVSYDGLRLLLSGTAAKNNNGELLAQFEILGVTDLFGGVYAFLDRYYPKVDRYAREDRNSEELHQIMSDHFYIRRLRADVSATPGKDRLPVAIEMSGTAATQYKAAEADLRSFLREVRQLNPAAITKAMRAEKLVKLNVLRRLAGLAKIENTISYVKDLVENGDQVLVFAHHRDIVKQYAAAFKCDTIMGGDKVEAIEAAKEAFQAGDKRVLVLNIEAGGVGHNLTAAKHVVFGELAWTPADMKQAEDRADRIGQTQVVLCHWLLAANGVSTVDERLVGILTDKGERLGSTLDGKPETLLSSDSITSALLASYEED